MTLRIGSDGLTPMKYDEIFRTSTTKQYDIGERAEDSLGCVYRYFYNGAAALDNNHLCQSAARIANHMNQTVVTAAAAGAKTFAITPGATGGAKNLYQDGLFYLNDAGAATTQEGYRYRVKSHPAITASTAFNITLYEGLQIATTTAGQWTLVHNPWSGVVVAPTTSTGTPVGVSMAVTAINAYGWMQTWGPCSVLINGTPAVGTAVTQSGTTAGAVDVIATNGQVGQIGIVAQTGVSGEYKEVWLTIAP